MADRTQDSLQTPTHTICLYSLCSCLCSFFWSCLDVLQLSILDYLVYSRVDKHLSQDVDQGAPRVALFELL